MWEIGMIPKISLAAAFVLMMAPPMACASNRDAANSASLTRQVYQSPPSMVLAQDGQPPSMGTTDNDNDNSSDNDNDSSDSADDNQNADSDQADQNSAGANQTTIPPTVLGAPDEEQSEPRQAPPVNPYQ